MPGQAHVGTFNWTILAFSGIGFWAAHESSDSPKSNIIITPRFLFIVAPRFKVDLLSVSPSLVHPTLTLNNNKGILGKVESKRANAK